jgi:Flp pilus assembly protein TadD
MNRGTTLFVLLILTFPTLLSAQSSAAGLLQARQLFDQKKFAEAAVLLERADQAGQAKPSDLVLLGMSYTELAHYDKARSALDKAAILQPQSAALMAARANLAFIQKRFADARELFKAAHELDPASPSALAGMVASLVNSGGELYAQGKTEEARKNFLQALVYDPGSVPAMRNLAILELQAGAPDKAAVQLEKAVAQSPKDAQLLRLLFLARNRQGDTAAQVSVLERLSAVQPADPEPWAVRGRLLESQGKDSEAAAAFQQAVQRGSQDPLPYYRLGASGHNRFLLHDSIGKAVQLAGALQLEAAQAAQKVKGKDDLRGIKLITTQVEEVRATLGSALTLLRQLDGDQLFEEDLKRLQSWYPGTVELLAAMARFYAEKGQWNAALPAWQRILQDHPMEPEAQSGIGQAFEKLGNHDQAILAYRRVLDLRPGSPDIFAALERLYAQDLAALRQILLDTSYRDTRNTLLFRELAKIETSLGLKSDADAHTARAAQIESGN